MSSQIDPELLPLYIRLYFDEDVSQEVVESLRTRGLDVTSALDAGMLRESDHEQLLYAVSQRRALVTHNRHDFEEEHRKFLEQGLKHYGIVVAKRRFPTTLVTANLITLLNTVTAEDMENQLRYV